MPPIPYTYKIYFLNRDLSEGTLFFESYDDLEKAREVATGLKKIYSNIKKVWVYSYKLESHEEL